ncbi:L,D-transpeptidase family protein [Hymenobacter sp. NST-14]|uniref:L,D-transpeptidase family protein n=1 Tax=Hymenobacter piscis TaxID=2839984 RepID=UPI001C02E3B2|nr:L,D-transpeptidase family protein [Hymenobacter piscis]MBT9392303.1 L,D-transpeptidase family protein [Hymenobacter piscis]
MNRIRRITQLVFLALALSLSPGAAAGGPAAPTPTGARAELRQLLDASAEAVARYEGLGLRAEATVRAFYRQHESTTYWVADSGWTPRAREALALLHRSADVGLDPARYSRPPFTDLPAQVPVPAADLARAELHLTDALLQYLHELRYGLLTAHTLTPRPTADSLTAQATADLLHAALAAPDLAPALLRNQPTARAYRLLQSAWVQALHQSPLDSARLMQDTTAGFRRVALNLERLRWSAPADSEYAVVNIPAYRLQLVRDGRVVLTHRVIVGKPEFPTPVLSSEVVVFVVAPEWRVPYSIAVREFLPELRRDPGYLSDHHYRLYDGRNRPVNPWHINWKKITPETFVYAIRQRAGSFNALGNVVFYFPNQHTVFLHDTPARAAFRLADRALSHGCVRVENPFKLADYLLRREGRARELVGLYQRVKAHEKQTFRLQRSLPIYLRYYTCETDNGRLVFLPDVYHQDAQLAAALFENS